MTEFNFGSLATTNAVSTTKQRFFPWSINDITKVTAEVQNVQGKKDPTQTYNILKIRFSNEDGYYEESIFFPNDDSMKRPIAQRKDGTSYERPSGFDTTMLIIAQVAGVVNPTGFAKLQSISSKIKTFDQLAESFTKVVNAVESVETKLKLIGKTNEDGTVVARLPYFAAINKKGERFPADNFLGDKVFFSSYEEKKRQEYLNATPTAMPSTPNANVELGESEQAPTDEFDINDLL